MTALFEPTTLGPLTLRNRIIKSATFEGRTPGGRPTPEWVEFHRRIAAGGTALTTVAYLSVSPEGGTDRNCIKVLPSVVDGMRELTDAVHAEGALAAAQLGHAGPVANSRSNGARSVTPSAMFNPLGMSRSRAADEYDIERITSDFVRSARLCEEAGFVSLELHLGHGYLLSSFLCPKLNKRTDRWGGSLENRARFPRQVVAAVREAVGRRLAVTVKLNTSDGFRGGLGVDESLEVARWLEQDGHLDAIELTGGSSLSNPMYLFRGDAPLQEFRETLPWHLRGGFRLVGDKFLKKYPYEEAFFIEKARRYRDALELPIILLGGISRLDTAESAIGEGFGFVAMGRALLHDPDLPNQWSEGTRDDSGCIHCNRCMPTIYTGTRCPLVDPRPGDRPIEMTA